VIRGPEEPWYEMEDEVTFNANNVGVAGIGAVMGVIRLTNDLLRELPDGWYYKLTRLQRRYQVEKGGSPKIK
jgi:hypothetical protein